MIPIFLDLRTGRRARAGDASFFWWTEGNGACDCNRAICFEGRPNEAGCTSKRFVAIDVEGDLEYDEVWRGETVIKVPHTKEQCLRALNSGYGT